MFSQIILIYVTNILGFFVENYSSFAAAMFYYSSLYALLFFKRMKSFRILKEKNLWQN